MSDHPKYPQETAIATYLAQHPDFFDRHGDILRDLRLHHPSGRAVSLIEKQVSALRERNTELRHRLNQLLDNARQNDRLFERSKRLVLSLLECDELGDLIDALYYSLDKEFSIPFVRLILFRKPQHLCSVKVASEDEAEVVLGRHLKASRAVGGGPPENPTGRPTPRARGQRDLPRAPQVRHRAPPEARVGVTAQPGPGQQPDQRHGCRLQAPCR